MKEQHYVTLAEAEELSGISAEALKKRCQDGRINGAIKRGKTWFVPKSEFLRDSNPYASGIKLLRALADLEDNLKHNYEKGNINQRALSNIAGLQADLFSSYVVLLGEDEKGPVIGRAVILRAILENQGAILHIKGNEKRAKAYLGHVEKIQQQVIDNVEGRKTPEEDLVWSKSKIKHRVRLIDDRAPRLYDMLSNFAHGNNVQYFMNTKELTDGFIKAIDSYFVGMFIGFLAELAIGLDMKDDKRMRIFGAIKVVGESKKYR